MKNIDLHNLLQQPAGYVARRVSHSPLPGPLPEGEVGFYPIGWRNQPRSVRVVRPLLFPLPPGEGQGETSPNPNFAHWTPEPHFSQAVDNQGARFEVHGEGDC